LAELCMYSPWGCLVTWLSDFFTRIIPACTAPWVVTLSVWVTLGAGALAIGGALWGLCRLVCSVVRMAVAWSRARHTYVPSDGFPFETLTLEQLRQRLLDEKLLTAVENPFVKRQWRVLHRPDVETDSVVIIASAERGKTREALEYVCRETQLETDVMVLWPTAQCVPSPVSEANCPRLGEHTILFWDSFENASAGTSKAMKLKATDGVTLNADERLAQIIGTLKSHCSRFTFVATARQEHAAERLPALNPQAPSGVWKHCHIISLPEFSQSEERQMVQGLTTMLGMSITSRAMSQIARDFAGASPESIVWFLTERRESGVQRITPKDVKGFAKRAYNGWYNHTYRPLSSQNPDVGAVYGALRCLRFDAKVPSPESLVIGLAGSLLGGRSTRNAQHRARQAYALLLDRGLISLQRKQVFVPDFHLERVERVDEDRLYGYLSLWRPRPAERRLAIKLVYSLVQEHSAKIALMALLRRIERAAQRDPVDWLMIGSVYALAGQYRDATRALERCTRLDPSDVDAWTCLGITLLGCVATTRAKRAFATAMRAERAFATATGMPNADEMAWAGLGGALAMRGEFVGAESAFERALELAPDSADSWHKLAMVRAELDNKKGALDALSEAVQRDNGIAAKAIDEPPFAGMREDPSFVALVDEFRVSGIGEQDGVA